MLTRLRDRIQTLYDFIDNNCHYKFVEPEIYNAFVGAHERLNKALDQAIKIDRSTREEIRARNLIGARQ
jgi:hypothetical protein